MGVAAFFKANVAVVLTPDCCICCNANDAKLRFKEEHPFLTGLAPRFRHTGLVQQVNTDCRFFPFDASPARANKN